MKHFVYFDSDFINSYLSQINSGLITSHQEETSDSIEKGKTEVFNPSTESRKLSLSALNLANVEYTNVDEFLQEIDSIKHTQLGKSLVSKIVHDNSYDNLITYLKNNNLLKPFKDNMEIHNGDFVHINDYLSIIDLSFIANIFGKDFNDIYNAINMKSLEELKSSLNREQRRDKKVKLELDKKEKEMKQELNDINLGVKIISFMSKILPSDTFIIYKNFFIPLNKKYFREDCNSIRFKYIEKANVVGKTTGQIRKLIKRELGNEFGDILNSLDDITLSLFDLLFPNKDFKILYPISLYFE